MSSTLVSLRTMFPVLPLTMKNPVCPAASIFRPFRMLSADLRRSLRGYDR